MLAGEAHARGACGQALLPAHREARAMPWQRAEMGCLSATAVTSRKRITTLDCAGAATSTPAMYTRSRPHSQRPPLSLLASPRRRVESVLKRLPPWLLGQAPRWTGTSQGRYTRGGAWQPQQHPSPRSTPTAVSPSPMGELLYCYACHYNCM